MAGVGRILKTKIFSVLTRNLALFARSVPKYVSSKKRQMTPPAPKKLVLTDTHDNCEASKTEMRWSALNRRPPCLAVWRGLCYQVIFRDLF